MDLSKNVEKMGDGAPSPYPLSYCLSNTSSYTTSGHRTVALATGCNCVAAARIMCPYTTSSARLGSAGGGAQTAANLRCWWNVVERNWSATPLSSICCGFFSLRLAVQQAVQHIDNNSPRKSTACNKSATRLPVDISICCVACCTTCCLTSRQQVEAVELELNRQNLQMMEAVRWPRQFLQRRQSLL